MTEPSAHRGSPLLTVEGLSLEFNTPTGPIRVVDGVDLEIAPGEIRGLVGESGSGKTVCSLAIAGLITQVGGRVAEGRVNFDGHDLLSYNWRDRSDVLGRDIGLIFQQPFRSLNPTMRIGDQIAEVLRRHEGLSKRDARARAVEMLDRVKIPGAAARARDFPHMFSGGMAQRVMIAMALVCRPKLLIADEPTTALDVTVQATVLELIEELQAEMGMAVLLITHDLGVVGRLCHTMSVMYCGQIVESGPVSELIHDPRHPYTAGLLAAMPRRGEKGRPMAVPGAVPAPDRLPSGCRFHPRCAHAVAGRCDQGAIELVASSPSRADRCVRSDELAGTLVTSPRQATPADS